MTKQCLWNGITHTICILKSLILERFGFAIILLIFGGSLANAQAVPFTPLHTYYISPTGNDANAGTSPNTAWASPRHKVVCGDVIIAAAGNYVAQYSVFGGTAWGTVSNCPSTSGGIDGKGGIYFATVLCAGPYVTSCLVNGKVGEAFRVDQSNWAVEGFTTTQNSNGANGCNMITSETAATLHHIAFINDIAVNCNLAGFASVSWTNPGGVDQTAVVGAIVYNSSPSYANGICGSGVSIIPVDGPDASAGTHVFVAGYFGYKNINAPVGAGCHTDGEGLIFDSWACGKFTHQGVAEQNVWWYNGGPGFEVFPNCLSNGDRAQVYVFNNTSYGNAQDPLRAGSSSDLLIGNIKPISGSGSTYSVFDNLVVSTQATSGNAGKAPVYAADFWLTVGATSSLVSATGNYFWQSNPGTVTTAGNPNTDVWTTAGHNTTSFPFGTNTYRNPNLANPKGLPTAAPNCNGYTNTTDCMNVGYHVAANLTPNTGPVGYLQPRPCAADPFFPVWLKGVVFLHWNGTGTAGAAGTTTQPVSAITENSGLITKPCGM
jgi:hypothetical protein